VVTSEKCGAPKATWWWILS